MQPGNRKPKHIARFVNFRAYPCQIGARGGVVVKAVRYKPAGRGEGRCIYCRLQNWRTV